ncbi:MAG: hypothetical protein HY298_19390 [Verrucomicrobia bacterium]|nr:hypothetical protein [Verrucomicrobiota bacterium]
MTRGCSIARFRRVQGNGVVLALLLLAFPFARIFGQGTLSTIFTNGPASQRLNIVVLSEGYQSNQLAQFLVDAVNTVSNLFAAQPFQEYSNYFNAFAISIASVESGSDHPVSGEFKNTYFNSMYQSYNNSLLITIPPNAWTNGSTVYGSNDYSQGKGKVQTLLTNLMPQYDFVILLVNHPEPGGSGQPPTPGDPLPLAITSINPSYGPEIVVHESGHMIGGLADEYNTAYPGFTPVEMPNATTQTNRAQIRWTTWILTNTPLPTPDDPTNSDLVGLFQGAQYQTNGWYRPRLDCKMNHLFVPFCEVCTEQLVLSIYKTNRVRTLDSFSPAATNFSIFSTQTVAFSVTPMQPATHDLTIQWYTNGVTISGATNPSFEFPPTSVGDGTHVIRAVVNDPTPLVRNDPVNLLRGTNNWYVSVSINQLGLSEALFLPEGRFRLTVTGTAPQGFVIQASTNLANWVSLLTTNLSAGRFDYTNSSVANVPYRFYRAYSPP